MKQSLRIALVLSVVLGTGLLVGCGSSEPTAEAPTETPTEAPTEAPTEPEPAPEPEPAAPAANQGTPINPPQSAILTAADADSRINLRSEPSATATAKGYGLVGDSVQLMKAATGESGLTWYYVKFDESGAEGWIRGDFVTTAGPSDTDSGTVAVGTFTGDELFASGAGGCGMTLLVAGEADFVFFHGVEPSSMRMKLNGELLTFDRTSFSGEEFYGQAPSQQFVSTDGGSRVSVSVVQGEQVDQEVFNIDSGTIQVESAGEVVTLDDLVGDVGC